MLLVKLIRTAVFAPRASSSCSDFVINIGCCWGFLNFFTSFSSNYLSAPNFSPSRNSQTNISRKTSVIPAGYFFRPVFYCNCSERRSNQVMDKKGLFTPRQDNGMINIQGQPEEGKKSTCTAEMNRERHLHFG